MPIRRPLLAALIVLAAPAAAQLGGSPGYKFLQAIRDSKGDEVIATLSKPGQTIINTRDSTTGEGALHIVVRRGDATYLRYLLQQGADPNLRDDKGTTPLLVAVTEGQADLIPILLAAKANPNLGNSAGETPLIRAVQRRDLPMVRTLLASGADPDQTDIIAGQSARDYATHDPRNVAVAHVLGDTPKKAKSNVVGPKF